MRFVEPRPERFRSILNECDAHRKRLHQARSRCQPFFPLTAETYAGLTDEQVEHVDQLVYRFTKLQDALGSKLFPGIVSAVRDDVASLTVLDGLNELERAGALADADRWNALRQIRNELAHDYEDDPEAGSRALNDVHSGIDELLKAAGTAGRFVRERILPSIEGR